mmetsp:Transcript_19300/g.53677  ORF Transcript_19300/g.53677 Transcript_19300/m.53677 type:complete len:260 (+) Transcript_19300:201-980(+)
MATWHRACALILRCIVLCRSSITLHRSISRVALHCSWRPVRLISFQSMTCHYMPPRCIQSHPTIVSHVLYEHVQLCRIPRAWCSAHSRLPWELESALLAFLLLLEILWIHPSRFEVRHGGLLALAVLVDEVVGLQREHELARFLIDALEVPQEGRAHAGCDELRKPLQVHLLLGDGIFAVLVVIVLGLEGRDSECQARAGGMLHRCVGPAGWRWGEGLDLAACANDGGHGQGVDLRLHDAAGCVTVDLLVPDSGLFSFF